MRRLILSLLFSAALSAGFMFAHVPAASAVELATDKIPCYCRYSDPNRLDAEEKLFCSGEIGFIGLVDNSDYAHEVIACSSLCGTNGWAFVGPSTLDSSIYGFSSSMAVAETESCVFSHYDSNHDSIDDDMYIKEWNTNYKNCKVPLNAIGKTETPQVCSFCYCKFKPTSAECAGKFSMVHITGVPSSCPALCDALNMDSVGDAIDDYSRCDYKLNDKCAKPINPTSPGCVNETANAATTKSIVTSRGSVVTLPLPLSNITPAQVIGRILSALLGIVGAIALLMFVWGGFQWMTARGNPDAVGKAKKTIVWASLGLVAIFSSYAVLSFVIKALQ